MVRGLESRVQGLACSVQGLESRVRRLECGFQGLGLFSLGFRA